MKKIIISIIATIILLASLISAININNELLEQHNNILKSYTIFDSKELNTYLIPDNKISPEEELRQIWTKSRDLRQHRLQKAIEREELEKNLELKSKRWIAIIDNDVYYGFDEEIYGTKEFYFYWK